MMNTLLHNRYLCLSLVLVSSLILGLGTPWNVVRAQGSADCDQGCIAYVGGHGTDIFVMNADGTGKRNITDTSPHVQEYFPAWSPDGQRIAFVSNRDSGPEVNSDVYVMNADGSNVIRLTTDPALDDFPLSWSPDGQFIAFPSDRGGSVSIYVVRSDGSEPPVRIPSCPDDASAPAWSPDGRFMAVQRRIPGGQYEIQIVDLVTGAIRTLAKSSYGPAWSPDGRRIVYLQGGIGDETGIYVVDIDGNNRRQIVNGRSMFVSTYASWSCDGQKIVFGAKKDKQTPENIFTVNVDGSGLTQLTNEADDAWMPAWKPCAATGFTGFSGSVGKKPAGSGTITGQVVAGDTEQPIANAQVTVGTAQATTDAQGYFALPDIAEGEYTLSIVSAGYETKNLSPLTVVQGASINLKVGLTPAKTTGNP